MTPLLSQVAEGIMAPTVSARRRISAADGLPAILLMVVLGYLIMMIFTGLLSDSFQQRTGSALVFHITGLALKFVEFFVIGAAVFMVGRMFGGVGTRLESYAVVAWHTLVTSFLSPLYVGLEDAIQLPDPEAAPSAPPEVDGGQLLMLFVFVGLSFWLLAKYVAELHGFKNIWGVLVSVVVGSFIFGLIAMILAPGLRG